MNQASGRRRVHVTRLKLSDFRNYPVAEIEADTRHVVLTGENGAGKTNLLESLSFLSPGRGLRRVPYETIARRGASGAWSVYAEIEGATGPVAIGTGIGTGAQASETQRRIRIDGEAVRGSEALLDHLRVVWLIPAMDGLFTGAAADRRRFLDRMVLAIDPSHGRRVADFEKSMRARNRLLGDGYSDPAWLDAIEQQMSETGIAIDMARAECMSLLAGAIETVGGTDSVFPDAVLSLHSGMSPASAGAAAASDLEEAYRSALAGGRAKDAAARRTLDGPHRGDLKVVHKDKQMPAADCSTGEQKALLIGIVLAHARLVADLSGFAPLILLDEIAAHLDGKRRAALFDRIEALNSQAWMTGTDRALFDSLGARAQYFAVDNGAVEREAA